MIIPRPSKEKIKLLDKSLYDRIDPYFRILENIPDEYSVSTLKHIELLNPEYQNYVDSIEAEPNVINSAIQKLIDKRLYIFTNRSAIKPNNFLRKKRSSLKITSPDSIND